MATGSISNMTYGSGIQIFTSALHGLSTGNTVVISGVVGPTIANGTWIITVVDANNFSIVAAGSGAYLSGGTWSSTSMATGVITAASNASPIVVTSASHGLTSGMSVSITGIVGNTAANGTWVVAVVDANRFSLVGSTGNHSYTSGGTFVVVSGSQITDATNANPIVITSVAHGLSTGDVVVISGVLGNTAANGTAAIPANPITKLTADTFSIPVAGNGVYISGGKFTVLHPILPSAPTTGTSSTYSSGLSDLVLNDQKQSSIPDGAQVYYGIKSAGVLLEAGIGFYNANSNAIVRTDVGYGNADGSFLSLDPGGADVSYHVAGPLVGPLPGVVATGVPLSGPTGILGPPKADTAEQSLAQAWNISTTRTVASSGALGPIIQNTPLPVTVRVNETPIAQEAPPFNLPVAYTFPGNPNPPGEPAGQINTAMISQTDQVLLSTSAGPPINQGRVSVNPIAFQNSTDSLGSGNRLYFVPADLPGVLASDSRVTLYCIDVVSGGYRNVKVLPTNGAISGPPSFLQLDAPSPIPFQYTSGDMSAQSTVRWGVPADIFLHVPVYSNPATVVPQLFYLNWWSATARTNGELGGAQRGHQLTTVNGRVNLKVVGESWNADSTVRSDDRLYLYVCTIVPVFDGIAANYPNLRLVCNQFNRLPYTDYIADVSAFWLVNDALHSDDLPVLWERMNPAIGTCGAWRHYYVDPDDFQSGVQIERNIPSINASYSFSAGAAAAGKVQIEAVSSFGRIWATRSNNSSPTPGGNVEIDGGLGYLEIDTMSMDTGIAHGVSGINYLEIQQAFSNTGRLTSNIGRRWGFFGSGQPLNVDLRGDISTGPLQPGTPVANSFCGLKVNGTQ